MVSFHKLISIYSSATRGSYFPCLKYLLRVGTRANLFGVRYFGTNFSELINKDRLSLHYWKSKRLFSSDSDSSGEQIKKALDNKEFQDVLKDFAKDFGVNEEAAEVLEKIKHNKIKEGSISDEDVSSRTKETLDIYHSISKERFKEFEDKDSEIIYSYEEELHLPNDFFHIDQEYDRQFKNYEVERGLTGVFDIEELIPILNAEKCFDITVIEVPKHYRYADYMVLATARSLRHIKAVTEFIRKFYKMKKNKEDPFVKIEGEKLGNWKAMDMGNIVLHVFREDVRQAYDLESLWLLDQKYDTGGTFEQDEVGKVLEEELEFLKSLKSEANPEVEITK